MQTATTHYKVCQASFAAKETHDQHISSRKETSCRTAVMHSLGISLQGPHRSSPSPLIPEPPDLLWMPGPSPQSTDFTLTNWLMPSVHSLLLRGTQIMPSRNPWHSDMMQKVHVFPQEPLCRARSTPLRRSSQPGLCKTHEHISSTRPAATTEAELNPLRLDLQASLRPQEPLQSVKTTHTSCHQGT